MKYGPGDLEVGKEYLAVSIKDPRNEVGVVIQVIASNGWIQCTFTRGVWRSQLKDYNRGESLALHAGATEFFDMSHLPTVKCRKCPKQIIWLKTTNDKNAPVDAETVLPKDSIFDPKRHMSHFATCPASAEFRKPKPTIEKKQDEPKPRAEPVKSKPVQRKPAGRKPSVRPGGTDGGRRGDGDLFT